MAVSMQAPSDVRQAPAGPPSPSKQYQSPSSRFPRSAAMRSWCWAAIIARVFSPSSCACSRCSALTRSWSARTWLSCSSMPQDTASSTATSRANWTLSSVGSAYGPETPGGG